MNFIKKIIVFFLIIISINVYSEKAVLLSSVKPPTYINAIKNLGEYFIDIKGLNDMDIIVHEYSKGFYIIHNRKTLEINKEDYYSRLDLLEKFDNSVLKIENKYYLRYDVLAKILSKKTYQDLDRIYFYDYLPKILSFKSNINEWEIIFDTFIDQKSVEITKLNEEYLITLKPISNYSYIPHNINYTYNAGTLYIRFKTDLNLNYEIREKTLKINLKKNEPIDLIKYKKEAVEINDEKITVYSAKFDPKKLKIKNDLNNLGKYVSAQEYFSDSEALLSINTAYFNPTNLEPVGAIIEDGEVLHLSAYSRPVFYITESGNMNIDYINMEYRISINDALFWIKSVNSNWKAEVKVYTSDYHGEIIENEEEYLFFVIENNKVKLMGKKNPKEKEKLLLINKKYEKYLKDIKIGSEISMELHTNIDENIKTLIEGGPILINEDYSKEKLIEERRSYSSGIISGKSPRTVLAIDKENMVTLLVIEGYEDKNKGLNYDGLKILLNKIGEYKKAIMFDGGGSSLMYYKNSIVNYGSERLRDYIPVFLSVYTKE